MKLKINLIIFFVLLSLSGFSQQLLLNGNWKYVFTNNKDPLLVDYDDLTWSDRPGDNLHFSQKEMNGVGSFVWLKKTIIIPLSLKSELKKNGAIALYLNKIDKPTKTYFNGKPIEKIKDSGGETIYFISANEIDWDKKNVIAIRIRSLGNGVGPKITPYIASAPSAELFIVSSSTEGLNYKERIDNKLINYTCNVLNRSIIPVDALISSEFYTIDGVKIKTITKKADLNPGENVIEFPYVSKLPFLKIIYSLTIPKYDVVKKWNDAIGYYDINYRATSPIVAYQAESKFIPAEIDKQEIDGWINARLNANRLERLYNVDEKRLLEGFINRPGTHPWIGEHVGKFLEAACNSYLNTFDLKLKQQIDRTVQHLISAQLNDGYLGTYIPEYYWTSWDVWSHKYNIIGLLSYYKISGYKPALMAAKRMGDLLCKTFGNEKGQKDIIIAGTHMGMAATSVLDPMTDLYLFSGDKKYLDFCYYIVHAYNQPNGPKIISTLNSTGRVNKTANKKAYELLSNLVGLLKLYRVTANENYLRPVLAAWKDIKENRLYITGTTSSYECFKDNDVLPAEESDHMGEGCVTTTWLQLNYQLLCIFGKTEYVDELERAVYNQLTGAENPRTGCVSYYTPLNGIKPFKCHITCCMSSIPRGIAMIPLFANGKLDGNPSFQLYQPGIYKTKVNNNMVEFYTTTDFLKENKVEIIVNPEVDANFSAVLRKPYWADNYFVTVNGEKEIISDVGQVKINRLWKKGDKISIALNLPAKELAGGKSYPGMVALQRGPQILVMDNKIDPVPARDVLLSGEIKELNNTPGVLPENWVGDQAYKVPAIINGDHKDIIIVPFADASQTGGQVTTWFKTSR